MAGVSLFVDCSDGCSIGLVFILRVGIRVAGAGRTSSRADDCSCAVGVRLGFRVGLRVASVGIFVGRLNGEGT